MIVLLLFCLIGQLFMRVEMVLPNGQNFAGRCSRTLVCGVGLCCRDSNGKVIPAALRYFTEIDYWRCNCSSELAKEGEVCDSFCLCGDGLYCTPNILCRNCGNRCNCVGGSSAYNGYPGYNGHPGISGYPGYAGGYGASPFGFGNLPLNPTYGTYPKGEKRNNNHTLDSNIKIIDNIVQLPQDLNINFEKPQSPPSPVTNSVNSNETDD